VRVARIRLSPGKPTRDGAALTATDRDAYTGSPFARLDGARAHLFDKAPWLGGRETGVSVSWTEADLECPVVPSKIVCIGRNYAAHAHELGHNVPEEPLLFLKPPSALLGPLGLVVLPPQSLRVEHEAELAVVLGKRARRISAEQALSHVFGYTCACDVTARDLQKKDVQFTRAKGFDTFCPVGPWIETELDPRALPIACRVNGKTRQSGVTSQMLFDVATLVGFASHVMTLEAGDVILTGTPEGVGPLASGDALEIEVEGVGVLGLRIGE
jgi:2-keto-4-pentenoate hydratase/2-oxohepta-3-ene-1,7-dioic acid hydratase in catechol pathway